MKALLLALTAIVVSTLPLWTAVGILKAATILVLVANLAAAVFTVGVFVGWPRRLARYFGTGKR